MGRQRLRASAGGPAGNLGRNTLIGPRLTNFDLALVKSFRLGEHRDLQFRAEAFNLPNHPSFAIPSGRTAFTGVHASVPVAERGSAGARPVIAPTWGRVISTVTTSRQIQFGLKLTS